MSRPSRLVLAAASTLAGLLLLGTPERWRAVLLRPAPATALATESVASLPEPDTARPAPDTVAGPDPFGTRPPAPVRAAAPAAPKAAPRPAPGPRPWRLVGAVGTRSAILQNGERTWVVAVGERAEGVRLVSLAASGAVLEDASGTWTVTTGQ